MIKSFKCEETERLFHLKPIRRIPASLQRSALRKLWLLDAAETLNDLKSPPGNRLEVLKGDRDGQCSMRINDQFRLCFIWQENNAYKVEIVDYH